MKQSVCNLCDSGDTLEVCMFAATYCAHTRIIKRNKICRVCWVSVKFRVGRLPKYLSELLRNILEKKAVDFENFCKFANGTPMGAYRCYFACATALNMGTKHKIGSSGDKFGI